MMDIQPIKSEADYEAAMDEVGVLWGSEPDTPEGDKLDILITLVEAYEREHHPIDPPDPIDAIKFRMEQQGISRKELEPYIGSRGRVSEVLNRKRDLSIQMIRELHTNLSIPLESLVMRSKGMQSAPAERTKTRR
jgi:HTH-type transcriptional regulator/antitoxin HigA